MCISIILINKALIRWRPNPSVSTSTIVHQLLKVPTTVNLFICWKRKPKVEKKREEIPKRRMAFLMFGTQKKL
jgi:hypothetical protein